MLKRRSFLTGLAALPAGITTAAAASAGNPTLDALAAEFERATVRLAAVSADFDEACDRLGDLPEAPAELRWVQADYWLLDSVGTSMGDGRSGHVEPAEIDKLRTLVLDRGEGYRPGIPRPCVEGRRRRDIIVDAWDRWQAAIKAAKDASGYTVADREYDAADAEHEALRIRIIDLRSSDPAVLALKIRVLLWSSDGLDYLDRAVALALKGEGAYADAVLISIARDAVAPSLSGGFHA